MAWRIEYAEGVQKSVRRLDRQVQRRLRAFLEVRLAGMDNPRQLGIAMQGTRYGDLWRYRVGNYRIMAEIGDERTRILVVRIARSQRCIPLATAQEAKGESRTETGRGDPPGGCQKVGAIQTPHVSVSGARSQTPSASAPRLEFPLGTQIRSCPRTFWYSLNLSREGPLAPRAPKTAAQDGL